MNQPARLNASVCVDAVLEDLSTIDAMQVVARCGYSAFEFWKWWDKDLEAIQKTRKELNLAVAAVCTKFVSLVDPSTRAEYLGGLEESIEAAKQLQCPTLISQVGDARPGVSRQEQRDCMIDGLKQAAPKLEDAGVTLAIEPLNELIDHAGYYLVRSEEAFEIIKAVDSPNVKVTFDIYHQQISEGHVIANLTENIGSIAHFHAAGNPGRHELDRGELHYPSIFSAIAETDYSGYVGLEYWPVDDAEAGLQKASDWIKKV
ncbi:TIM barrel protein [Rhodopirellula sp. JC740]|uniref:TIM barrel protein n=1 Tax=Rhodopirellula halodulae TaxID=2894198 RepID=A0ABS8NKM5_9BACT|nr:TIM barrel protein [Rhodopirellula sp. JC740]MCC9644099.1 TIM barrel protein [Rhodopirellula sp. JC740]